MLGVAGGSVEAMLLELLCIFMQPQKLNKTKKKKFFFFHLFFPIVSFGHEPLFAI